MSKRMILSAAFLIFFAIILGAMAAHGLSQVLSEKMIETFEKGVRYQFYAGFGILILGLAADKFSFHLSWFHGLTLTGVLLFSGCIYGYCFSDQIPGLKPLVYLVPFGGTALITAWGIFIIQVIRKQKS